MGISITVTEDRAQWDILTARLDRSGGARIEAGLFGAKQAKKAALAESGTRTAKARPFMSVIADNMIPSIGDEVGRGLKKIIKGIDPKVAFDSAGELVSDALISTIRDQSVPGPGNKKSTRDSKGHSQVLIGKKTGRRKRDKHMVDSIKHRTKVRKVRPVKL